VENVFVRILTGGPDSTAMCSIAPEILVQVARPIWIAQNVNIIVAIRTIPLVPKFVKMLKLFTSQLKKALWSDRMEQTPFFILSGILIAAVNFCKSGDLLDSEATF